jgi:hypothetical protein
MYVGNGATATAVQRTAVGECVTSGVAVTSVTPYAKLRQYISADQAIPASGTAVTVSHNMGVPTPYTGILTVFWKCTTAEFGYSIGDMIPFSSVDTSINVFTTSLSRLAASLNSSGYGGIGIAHKTTGARNGITTASWRFVFVITPIF